MQSTVKYRAMYIPLRSDTSTALSQVTSACDDDINLANDLVQLDHPESIHAVHTRGKREVQHSVSVSNWLFIDKQLNPMSNFVLLPTSWT